MTTTATPTRPQAEERTVTFLDWLQGNTRFFAVTAGLVAAILVGGWLYTQQTTAKAHKAERALAGAMASLESPTPNQALAINDLQKVVNKYGGTPAAAQASMLVAELSYDKGEYQKGIDALKKTAGSRGSRELEPDIQALMAAGYSQLGKQAEAAEHYIAAAEATRFAADRAQYRASAARAYEAAGNRAQALKIWRELVEDPSGGASEEARLRIGELEASAAVQSSAKAPAR
jgi:predicted negative regulator of RcsB-dependent stress response